MVLQNLAVAHGVPPSEQPISLIALAIFIQTIGTGTVSQSHPLPQLEDCGNSVGLAAFVIKLDLLKGSWQVAL